MRKIDEGASWWPDHDIGDTMKAKVRQAEQYVLDEEAMFLSTYTLNNMAV